MVDRWTFTVYVCIVHMIRHSIMQDLFMESGEEEGDCITGLYEGGSSFVISRKEIGHEGASYQDELGLLGVYQFRAYTEILML